jgi:3(or 17)beta-hydroxysteroid dehydrogenase
MSRPLINEYRAELDRLRQVRCALAQLPQDSAGLDQINNHGMGDPGDVANMILYLASDDGRHITGTTITIDNGETMQ